MLTKLRDKEFFGAPFNVWMLGFVTFLKNTSSVVLVVFCPLYLAEVLCVNMATLGTLEGFVEALSFFSRVISGSLSDKLHKRKPVLLFGYALSLLGRLLLTISSSLTGVVVSRSCERLGNGIQGTPRDALVADYSTPKNRVACFGLRQSLTVSGSVVGAFAAMKFMQYSNNDYRALFSMTLIPSVLAILVLIFTVSDRKTRPKDAKPAGQWHLRDLKQLPLSFWKLALFSTVVMLSNFGNIFLILAARKVGLPSTSAPLIMMVQGLSTALFAWPLGRLADRIGKRKMVPLGITCLMLGNLGMGFATTLLHIYICVILWGLQMGILYNAILSYVSEVTPEKLRATAIGSAHLFSGIGTLIANYLTGMLWGLYGSTEAFVFNAALGLLALLLTPFCLPGAKGLKGILLTQRT